MFRGKSFEAVEQNYRFNEITSGIKLTIEWTCPPGVICDLDLCILLYDERARFIEKLSVDRPVSIDGSCKLEGDIQNTSMQSMHHENVKINLHSVSIRTYAIALLIDGGSRNFQSVQKITLYCSQQNSENINSLAKMAEGGFVSVPLFQFSGKPRRDHTAVVASILYKNGIHPDGSAVWFIYNIFEGIFAESSGEKDRCCHSYAVSHVPTFHKYRPHIFPSVKALCEALSSTSLPSLKSQFLESGQKGGGLNIRDFTETIFKHLHAIYPKILEHEEAANTVAVIQEMFCQMNYNEDPMVDWEEFTTFCIQTDVEESINQNKSAKLDTYVIEYSENTNRQDHTLSGSAPLAVMKYIASEKRILTIQDSGTHINLFTQNFEHISVINPLELTNHNASVTTAAEKIEKCKIYDCCYLPSKDTYAYCASDHSIVICKEHSTGKKVYYTIVNKLYSSTSHVKLCWGDKTKILCSVDSDNVIFGWDIESVNQPPLFQISRHQDLITDFIALDHLDLFLTCSLDKRIVMWSQSSRRVRGVLLGHKRGVKCMSYAKDMLLTAGYESNARTWDLNSKELLYILSGHRHPIQAGKLMCPNSSSGLDMRAITLDQSGEFRLWNCSVRDRTDSHLAEVLQIFSLKLKDGSDQTAKIRFLEFPYDPQFSIGVYSDIIAGSPGLIHIVPEKTINDFIPPTTICCAEPSGYIITACGADLFKYDLCSGTFTATYQLDSESEVTCSCGDGNYARRMFVGFANGRLAIVNYTTGKILESVMVNPKGVSCISVFKVNGLNLLYVGSPDGRISCIEDTQNGLNIHLTAEQVIGDNCGINRIVPVESLSLIVASSGGKCWGIWDSMTFRRLFLIEEDGIISDICVIGSSRDKADVDERMSLGMSTIDQGHTVTVAISCSIHINIYTADSLHSKIAFTHRLRPQHIPSVPLLYLSGMTLLRAPDTKSLNYSTLTSSSKSKLVNEGNLLISSSDEGYIVIWNIHHIRKDSKARFQSIFPLFPTTSHNSLRALSSAESFDFNHAHNTESTLHPHHPTFITYGHDGHEGSHLAGFDHHDHAHPTTKDSLDDRNNHSERRSSFYEMRKEHEKKSHNKRREKHEEEMKLKKSQSMFRIKVNNDDVGGRDSYITETSKLYFFAHADLVTCLISLNDSGCILTASMDGYQRIWNMDADCLGELPLPNLSEKLKNNSLFRDVDTAESQTWKFILERIPVNISHRDIARKLVLSILQPQQASTIAERDRRRVTKNAILYGGATISDLLKVRNQTKKIGVNDEKTRERTQLLMELCAPRAFDEEDNWRSSLPKDITDTSVKRSQGSISPSEVDPFQLISEEFRSGGGECRPKTTESSVPRIETNKSNHRPSTASAKSVTSSTSQLPPSVRKVSTGSGKNHLFRKTSSTHIDVENKTVESATLVTQVNANVSVITKTSKTTLRSAASSQTQLWKTPSSMGCVEEAFSTNSITESKRRGLINSEEFKTLNSIHKDEERLEAFNRQVPQFVVRNTSLSTRVVVPKMEEVSHAEMIFGPQKHMYKNANASLHHTKSAKSLQQQHIITLSRINQSTRRIGTLVHVFTPPKDDDLDINISSTEASGNKSTTHETEKTNDIPISRAPTGPIDMEKIDTLIKRIADAESSSIPEWERHQHKAEAHLQRSRSRKEVTDSTMISVLERQLITSIKRFYDKNSASVKHVTLSARTLLPYYKISDVTHFLDSFQRVDANLSGDLDVEEWCHFFTALNKNINRKQARIIFNRVDTAGKGTLSIRDLIPVVFSSCNKSVQNKIFQYVECELSKRKIFGKDLISVNDLEKLFEFYDYDAIGFISVGVIREKIKALQLPDTLAYTVIDETIADLSDDDMINSIEFTRIFRNYCLEYM